MRRTTPPRWLVLSAIAFLALGATLHAATASARPWLGVYTQEITDELRDGLNLNSDGVLVNRVVSDGPADRGGVRKGDVIVRFNSRSVDSPSSLADLVGDAREGQTIALAVVRQGQTRTLSVTLAARPEDEGENDNDNNNNNDEDMAPTPPTPPEAPEAPPVPRSPRSRNDVKVKIITPEGGKPRVYHYEGDPDKMPGDVHEMMRGFDKQWSNGMPGFRGLMNVAGRGRLGVRIESLSDDLASALDVTGGEGVLVLEVIKDTPAERAGLRAGDVIVSLDGHSVKDSEALVDAIRDADGRVSIAVVRKGARRTVEAELRDAPRGGGGDDSSDEGRMGDRVRVLRSRDLDNANGAELRKEMEELRRQLRELRRQLEEKR
jgi:membrane-associated protease RseP (regulator of RpoE activity)